MISLISRSISVGLVILTCQKHCHLAAKVSHVCELHLGTCYFLEGELKKAEPLLLNAMKIKESAVGKDSPHMAKTLNNLANMYEAEGELEKAEKFYKRAMEICEKNYGRNNLKTLHACMKYANLLAKRNKLEESARISKRVDDIRRVLKDG